MDMPTSYWFFFFFFCEQASVKDDESPKKDEPKFQAFSGKSYSLKR